MVWGIQGTPLLALGVLAIGAGCSGNGVTTNASVPPPATAAASSAAIASAAPLNTATAPSAATPEPAPTSTPATKVVVPPIDETVGTFFIRAQLVDKIGEEYACSPMTVLDAAAVPNTQDEAWFVGTCGLRLRHRAGAFSGTVESGNCGPRVLFGVWAYSAQEVYAHSGERIIVAPSGACGPWRPLERFDGRRWRTLGPPVASGPSAGSATALWLLPDPLYEEPSFRIERFKAGRWTIQANPPTPVGYHDVGAHDGGLWVLGGNSDEKHNLIAAHFDGASWVEHTIVNDDRPSGMQLTVAPDGTAWIAENAVWRATRTTLTKLDLPPSAELQGIALAKSSNEVWLNVQIESEEMVLRFDGERYTRLEVRGSPLELTTAQGVASIAMLGTPRTVLAHGEHTWLFAADLIWQLAPPGTEPPPRVRLRAAKMGALQVEQVAADELL